MSNLVLDSSVILALANGEPVSDWVLASVNGAIMSTVNVAEVLSRMSQLGPAAGEKIDWLLGRLASIEPFTYEQAVITASLRAQTRSVGLSLGDRACLALAMELGAEVYTADRQWASLPLPCPIRLIR